MSSLLCSSRLQTRTTIRRTTRRAAGSGSSAATARPSTPRSWRPWSGSSSGLTTLTPSSERSLHAGSTSVRPECRSVQVRVQVSSGHSAAQFTSLKTLFITLRKHLEHFPSTAGYHMTSFGYSYSVCFKMCRFSTFYNINLILHNPNPC